MQKDCELSSLKCSRLVRVPGSVGVNDVILRVLKRIFIGTVYTSAWIERVGVYYSNRYFILFAAPVTKNCRRLCHHYKNWNFVIWRLSVVVWRFVILHGSPFFGTLLVCMITKYCSCRNIKWHLLCIYYTLCDVM